MADRKLKPSLNGGDRLPLDDAGFGDYLAINLDPDRPGSGGDLGERTRVTELCRNPVATWRFIARIATS